MEEKSNFTNLFWILMAVLLAALAIFGGMVAWKLVREAVPQVERTHADPETLFDQTASSGVQISDAEASKNAALQQQLREQVRLLKQQEGLLEEDVSSEEEESQSEQAPQETEDENKEALSSPQDVQTETQPAFRVISIPQPAQAAANKVTVKAPVGRKRWHASYKQGLLRCQREKAYPCAWDDVDDESRIVRYWLRTPQGPVERIVYARDSKRSINQTFATVDGTVLAYNGAYAQLYFENGLLTKIRTFPYSNPNLRDWFLIDKNGRISACLCGMPTQNCCARSFLYREGGHRRFCDLFPMDKDFCKN